MEAEVGATAMKCYYAYQPCEKCDYKDRCEIVKVVSALRKVIRQLRVKKA